MFKLGTKTFFRHDPWLRVGKLLTVLTAAIFQSLKLTVPRMETIYKSWVKRTLNSGPFSHFRFANHHFNWQILIKVWTSVIGLSCLIRTILEYEKVRQIWTLLLGHRQEQAQFKVYYFKYPTVQRQGSLLLVVHVFASCFMKECIFESNKSCPVTRYAFASIWYSIQRS